MRISAEQRQRNETRIRAVMDQLLSGEIPPGGKCDIKTLAREAAVDRAAFYGTRPYAHLRQEFEARLKARQQASDLPDRRDAQIARLKDEITTLRQRLADRDHTITDLRDFKNRALAQLAGQHDEINRLRTQNQRAAKVRQLPARTSVTGHASDPS
jgi:chromosome segregation ATPase